jgi:hypothetical protein
MIVRVVLWSNLSLVARLVDKGDHSGLTSYMHDSVELTGPFLKMYTSKCLATNESESVIARDRDLQVVCSTRAGVAAGYLFRQMAQHLGMGY